jgi:cation:H+ antiporter
MTDGPFAAFAGFTGLLARQPWAAGGVFCAASLVLVWALERMARHGLEGTALGTIAMPWCSGLGNLVFAILAAGERGSDVVVNALVNNATNATLLVGLPAALWGLELAPGRRSRRAVRAARVDRLSLLLSLAAGGCFAAVLWALAADGVLDRGDGAALILLFAFWQSFHVCDVLKAKAQQGRGPRAVLAIDAALVLAAGAGICLSVEAMAAALARLGPTALGGHAAGWITGWVMVLPNALLAFYYGWRRQAGVVLSSQLGDGHVCIPLCVGMAAVAAPVPAPAFLGSGLLVLGGALAVLAAAVGAGRGLPRWLGAVLIAAYAVFLVRGLG